MGCRYERLRSRQGLVKCKLFRAGKAFGFILLLRALANFGGACISLNLEKPENSGSRKVAVSLDRLTKLTFWLEFYVFWESSY